jgi:hypothetical protein
LTKGIKIKTFLLFTGWLMILGHSIIPHNHLEHDYATFHSHLHSSSDNHEKCSFSDEFHTQDENSGTCSISTLLYHQLSQDYFLIHSARLDFWPFAAQKGSIIYNADHNFFKTNFFGSAYLRSPPLV